MNLPFNHPSLPALFWARVLVHPATGCWLWTGAAAGYYGTFNLGRRKEYTHRITLGLAGQSTPGHDVDHLCETKLCCFPLHLELVTHQVNCDRADYTNSGWHNRLKTHCPAGHEYTAENTYLAKLGKYSVRRCRLCLRETKRRYLVRSLEHT